MNIIIIEIIDESFKMTESFGPDHKNIVEKSPPSVGKERTGALERAFISKMLRKRLANEGAILVPIAVPWICR